MILRMNKTVDEFIRKFKSYNKENVLESTFLNGYCYQFAIILKDRFDGVILYEPIEGHFIIKIDNELYDIRGNVTSMYQNKTLYDKEQWITHRPIVEGSILKTS